MEVRRSRLLYTLILSFAATGSLAPLQGRSAERQFLSGYVGTLPPSQEDRAGTYFARPEVRGLLAALESRPIPSHRAETALSGTSTRLQDLLRLHLVREDQGMIRIGFPYFTATDMKMIHAVAVRYVPSLVAAYKANQKRTEIVLDRYSISSVSRKRLAFVVIAGFGLNWDALDLLLQRGYRKTMPVYGAGWQYGFWVSENLPDYSYLGFYWGSSTFPADTLNLTPPLDFAFSSFGDALSEPRMNLPDLLALPPAQLTEPVREAAERLGLHDDDELDMGLKNVIGLYRARALGAMLFAMRHGATSTQQICEALSVKDRPDCSAELALLLAIGYVKSLPDRNYELSVPVLDEVDRPMLDSVLALSRSVIERWLEQNYSNMHQALTNLTAARQGVSYEVMFSQIWHELFGLATRELTAQGVIEDPRATGIIWQGSIPAVWRSSVYQHKFE